jgi:uncharacterized protein
MRRPFDERGLDDHLVEPRRVRTLEPRFVGVVRVPEDRDVRPRVDDLIRLDARDVCDDEVGCVDRVARHEPVSRKQPFQFPAEEKVDPDQQDRRHGATVAPSTDAARFAAMGLQEGLELIREGSYFEAHEELEDEWRTAPDAERDFLQGLVHVAVAWLHAERGNRNGCERQLVKAERRLGSYRPTHRGVDVAGVLAIAAEARRVVAAGSLELPPLRV